jgi:hypothetical protein
MEVTAAPINIYFGSGYWLLVTGRMKGKVFAKCSRNASKAEV